MKILVLSQSYPNQKKQTMAFVHTRNQYYAERGHQVTVLSFDAASNYEIDQLQVVTESHFKERMSVKDFDLVISHAPNLRNHIRFLVNNKKDLFKVVFFIHGHEVLRKIEYYPKPYRSERRSLQAVWNVFDDLYDQLKLKVLPFIFRRIFKEKAHFVFVSQWMKEHFLKNLQMNDSEIQGSIISNSVHPIFTQRGFNPFGPKIADFIAIRQFDSSKYAVDLVVQAAEQNPEFQFHLYGRGRYFESHSVPNNLKVFQRVFKHHEMPDLLDQYKAAFMPTRQDSQGVMVCEMATYRMPVITSDIPICREVLKSFTNVTFVPNEPMKFDARLWSDQTQKSIAVAPPTYLPENTMALELDLFKRLVRQEKK